MVIAQKGDYKEQLTDIKKDLKKSNIDDNTNSTTTKRKKETK